MISLSIISLFIFAHFISDSISNIYDKKSEGLHSVIYGLSFLVICIPFIHIDIAFHFAIFSGVLHYSVDFITGIVRKKMHKKYYTLLDAIDHSVHLTITFYIYSVLI